MIMDTVNICVNLISSPKSNVIGAAPFPVCTVWPILTILCAPTVPHLRCRCAKTQTKIVRCASTLWVPLQKHKYFKIRGGPQARLLRYLRIILAAPLQYPAFYPPSKLVKCNSRFCMMPMKPDAIMRTSMNLF